MQGPWHFCYLIFLNAIMMISILNAPLAFQLAPSRSENDIIPWSFCKKVHPGDLPTVPCWRPLHTMSSAGIFSCPPTSFQPQCTERERELRREGGKSLLAYVKGVDPHLIHIDRPTTIRSPEHISGWVNYPPVYVIWVDGCVARTAGRGDVPYDV